VFRRIKAILLGALLVLVVLAGWTPYARPLVEHARHAGRGGIGAPAARLFVPPFLVSPARPEVDYVLDYHERLYPPAARAIVKAASVRDAYGRLLRGAAYVMFGLCVVGAALAARRLAGVAGAWLAGMLVLACAGQLLISQAGTPPWALGPAFLLPVVAALVAGRVKTAVLLIVPLAAMSPVLALPATLALALLLFVRPADERGGAAGWGRAKRLVAVGIALGATIAGAAVAIAELAPYGAPFASTAGLDDAFLVGVESFSPWGPALWGAPHGHPALLGWLIGCGLLAGAFACTRTPDGRRFLVTVLTLAGSALFLRPLSPYLDPSGKTDLFPVFLLGSVLLPAALAAPFREHKWRRFFAVAILGGLLVVCLGGRGTPMTGLTRRQDTSGLDAALFKLSPRSLVAGPPADLDDVNLFVRRRVYASRLHATARHQGFASELARRNALVREAQIAPGEAGWRAMRALRDDGVTHLVVASPPPGSAAAEAVRAGYPIRAYHSTTWALLDLAEIEATRGFFHFAEPRPPKSLAEWELRAPLLRTALRGFAELPLPGPVTQRAVLEERVIDGVLIRDLLLDGWAHLSIPATLFLPAERKGPVPAVLLFVGHDRSGRSAPYARAAAWRLAHQGVAALVTDWMGMGTRARDDARHVELGMHLIPAGIPPVSPMIGEPWRAFDWLVAQPEIDPTRVAVAGQSGGAIVAMHLAALEPRVAAAVVIDIVVTNDFIRETGWGDPDTFVPHSLRLTEHGEILGLIAPRPLLVLSGAVDLVAPSRVGEEALATTRAIYGLYGAQARVSHHSTEERHAWSWQKTQKMLAFLADAFGLPPFTGPNEVGVGTEPHGGAPESEPPWFEAVTPRLARGPGGDRALLAARVGPTPIPGLPPRPARGVTLLWIADRPLDHESLVLAPLAADTVVPLLPTGLGAPLTWDQYDRLHLVQNAIGLGGSVLGAGVGRLTAEVRALRAGGAERVVAICDGRQAALLCVTTAALHQPFDALIVEGYPADFEKTFFFEEQPDLYYVTPGLFSSFSAEGLAALVAPTPMLRDVGILEGWLRLGRR
jgi:hypothetical protein